MVRSSCIALQKLLGSMREIFEGRNTDVHVCVHCGVACTVHRMTSEYLCIDDKFTSFVDQHTIYSVFHSNLHTH